MPFKSFKRVIEEGLGLMSKIKYSWKTVIYFKTKTLPVREFNPKTFIPKRHIILKIQFTILCAQIFSVGMKKEVN